MKLDSRYPHLNAGWQHFQRKELDAAIRCFSESIKCKENFEKSYYLRGNVWLELKNFELAISDYTAALGYAPDLVEALLNRGTAFQETGQMAAAMDDFNQVIQLKPNLFNGYFNRARLSKALNSTKEALDDFCRALSIAPASLVIRDNIGALFVKMGEHAKALQVFNEILAEHPDHVQAISNRGIVLKLQDRYDEAIRDFEKAIQVNPNLAIGYYNLGRAQIEMGSFDLALENFREARNRGHKFFVANWGMSLCHLAAQDFLLGWDLFEDRLKAEEYTELAFIGHSVLEPRTDIRNLRNDLNSKTVFLASEQGVGDCIMFLSILPDLIKDADKVFCQLDFRLIQIFSRIYPEVTFFGSENDSILNTVHIDRRIRLGSLGYSYRQDLKDFPRSPYLMADPTRITQWKTQLPVAPDKLKIGISWRGGTEKTNRKDRSMTLEQLAPLLDRKDCIFVSLQYGEVEAEIAAFNEGRPHKLICFPQQEINDFEDFTGLIGTLDCVVSVQNTTVHTCGALGKPCYTMLPFRPEWRYGASGDNMPWYGSVKLFRQSQDGQWNDVINKINATLELLVHKNANAQ